MKKLIINLAICTCLFYDFLHAEPPRALSRELALSILEGRSRLPDPNPLAPGDIWVLSPLSTEEMHKAKELLNQLDTTVEFSGPFDEPRVIADYRIAAREGAGPAMELTFHQHYTRL